MPWTTPTLQTLRAWSRDYVAGALATVVAPKERLLAALNAQVRVGNSVLRVMTDTMTALAQLNLKYLDWQALQYLPDTAEDEWLNRHGQIWLTNADGSHGLKAATFATGTVTLTGTELTPVPIYTNLESQGGLVGYETTEAIVLGPGPTNVSIRALDPGVAGNAEPNELLAVTDFIPGVDRVANVVILRGGADQEQIDELRARVLQRIRQPPMGGAAYDYIAWAEAVVGVTRAWSYPLEMGIGTVTVRFMCDDLRAGTIVTDVDGMTVLAGGGFPITEDIVRVNNYLQQVRPVAVKDFFLVAPVVFFINFTITDLSLDDAETRAQIEAAVILMLQERCSPGSTVYRSWVDEAISGAIGENHHELTYTTTPMPSPGHIPVLGTITYA